MRRARSRFGLQCSPGPAPSSNVSAPPIEASVSVKAKHLPRWQVLFTLLLLCPALIWWMFSSSAPEKSEPKAASNSSNSSATQSVVQQPAESSLPPGAVTTSTSKDVTAKPGEIEAIQVYFRKLYTYSDAINRSYEQCQSAAKKSLASFDTVGASRAFAVHGAVMVQQLKALNSLILPAVIDETARKHIQSAKDGVIEDASAQRRQAAIMARTVHREEDVAEAARLTTLSNMATAKFVMSVMRTYERYGYAMDDVDIDTHVLKRGAQSKSKINGYGEAKPGASPSSSTRAGSDANVSRALVSRGGATQRSEVSDLTMLRVKVEQLASIENDFSAFRFVCRVDDVARVTSKNLSDSERQQFNAEFREVVESMQTTLGRSKRVTPITLQNTEASRNLSIALAAHKRWSAAQSERLSAIFAGDLEAAMRLAKDDTAARAEASSILKAYEALGAQPDR